MPSLTFLGRRWLSGSDDFFLTGVYFCLWNLACALCLLLTYHHGECHQEVAPPLGYICLVGAASFLLLTIFTCKGRILETSSRWMVAPILYLCVLEMLAMLGAGIWAVVEVFKTDGIPVTCNFKQVVALKLATLCSVILPCVFFFVSFVLRYDSNGGVPESELRANPELYHESWVSKIRTAFCCCVPYDDHHEYYDHVASVLAYLFQGHDIVPTDILAGMALLGSHQRRVLNERAAKTNFDWGKCKQPLHLSHQAMPLHALTEDDRKVVDVVAHFSKYFMAAYGWMLFIYKDLKCGPCKLLKDWMCSGCCCRTRPGKHFGDDCCFCDNVAMSKIAQLNEEDILLTSFMNDVMRPAFYVALDRETSTIVICIRGTMSFQDTLVDLVATPVRMNISDLPGPTPDNLGTCLAHGGILKSSTTIFECLTDNGIFNALIDGDHKNRNIKIIGHSLGAGCATLVSLLIRERHPELKPRLQCLAFSPPGGLLSRDLAAYTESFCVSPFVGMDVIPRLALHTIQNVRDALFECLSAAEHNKNKVLLLSACGAACGGGGLLPEPEDVPALSNEASARIALLLSGHLAPETMAETRDAKITQRGINKSKGGGSPAAMKSLQEPLSGSSSPSNSKNGTPAAGSGSTIVNVPSVSGVGSDALQSSPSIELHRESSQTFDAKLYPPGRLLHYTVVGSTDQACGWFCGVSGTDTCCSRRVHLPMWVSVDDLQEIMCSPSMMLDHFPDRCQNIFEGAAVAVRDGDYEGCFDPKLTAEEAMQARRDFKPLCFSSPNIASLRPVGAASPHLAKSNDVLPGNYGTTATKSTPSASPELQSRNHEPILSQN